MAKKKEGFISKEEEEALRENAKIVSEQSRGMFQSLVPHRIDSKTVVLVNPDKDLDEQLSRYTRKLEISRMNY